MSTAKQHEMEFLSETEPERRQQISEKRKSRSSTIPLQREAKKNKCGKNFETNGSGKKTP